MFKARHWSISFVFRCRDVDGQTIDTMLHRPRRIAYFQWRPTRTNALKETISKLAEVGSGTAAAESVAAAVTAPTLP